MNFLKKNFCIKIPQKAKLLFPLLQNTFQSVAMKVMRKEPSGEGFNSEAKIKREIAILKSVQHVSCK
jgi:hypothetical protein